MIVSQNRFKNLSPEYVEEQCKLAAESAAVAAANNANKGKTQGGDVPKDIPASKAVGDSPEPVTDADGNPVKESADVSEDTEVTVEVEEAAYIDMLLDALDD